jgi:hypothetical protein
MRKIFGGAMLFSALGAVLLGGALAWNATETIYGSNVVGTVDFDLVNANYTNNQLGPNGSPAIEVVQAEIDNNGSFSLYLQTATTDVYDVNSFDATCLEAHFIGGGHIEGGSALQTNPEVPPGATEGWVVGTVATDSIAPEACQGSTVFWAFHVTMGTSAP